MSNEIILSQIRQRLEILYQMVDELEQGGGTGDYYTKAETNALLAGKVSPTDYATQTTGGTIKAWTTTDGSDTILHLATQ